MKWSYCVLLSERTPDISSYANDVPHVRDLEKA